MDIAFLPENTKEYCLFEVSVFIDYYIYDMSVYQERQYNKKLRFIQILYKSFYKFLEVLSKHS